MHYGIVLSRYFGVGFSEFLFREYYAPYLPNVGITVIAALVWRIIGSVLNYVDNKEHYVTYKNVGTDLRVRTQATGKLITNSE